MFPDQTQTTLQEAARDVALLKQAVAAYRLGDKPRARELLIAAAEINPENPLIWLWQASVAATYKEAVSSLERVLQLDPGNKKAQQWMDKLRQAREEALRKAGLAAPEPVEASGPELVREEEAQAEPEEEAEAETRVVAETSVAEQAEVAEQNGSAGEEADPLVELLAEREGEGRAEHPEAESSVAETPLESAQPQTPQQENPEDGEAASLSTSNGLPA